MEISWKVIFPWMCEPSTTSTTITINSNVVAAAVSTSTSADHIGSFDTHSPVCKCC